MIGKLKGVVDSFGEDFVILDVSGVGYIVHCSARTLQRMPKVGEPASLSIETHVREDMIRLYGFRSDAEREWFRLLQTVQGVGARVALGVLSVMEPEALASAIATGDKGAISRAPGVGPRLAARLAAELKDKAPAFAPIDPALVALTGAVEDGAAPAGGGCRLRPGQSRLPAGPGRRRHRCGSQGCGRGRRGQGAHPARPARTRALTRPGTVGAHLDRTPLTRAGRGAMSTAANKALKSQLLFNSSKLAQVPGTVVDDRCGRGDDGICGAHDRLFL